MRRLIAIAVVAAAALALSAPAMAATTSLFGGATQQQNGVVSLVSDLSDTSTANDFSGIAFSNLGGLTFSQLKFLGAQYNVTDDGCGGGSPRFQLNIGGKNVFVYLGPAPSFTACPLNTWISTGNLIGSTQAIFDLSQLGGPQAATYQQALQFLGNQVITGVQLVVDSGWFFVDREQTVLVRNVVVGTTLGAPTLVNGKLNPAHTCKTLRSSAVMGSTLFTATFGTNKNGRNAFGKCVSMMAKLKKTGSLALVQAGIVNVVAACKASGATGTALTQCVRTQIAPLLGLASTAASAKAKPPKKPKGK